MTTAPNQAPSKPIWTNNLRGYPIGVAAFPEAGLVVLAGIDGELFALEAGTGRLRARVRAHEGGLTAMAALPGGTGVATGGEDGRVRAWALDLRAPRFDAELGREWVDALAVDGAGRIAAGAGRCVAVLGADGRVRARHETPAPVRAVAFAGGRLLAATHLGAWLADPADGRPVAEFPFQGSPHSTALSPDERWFAVGLSDRTVRLLDLANPSTEAVGLGPFQSKPKHLCWAPDGSWLAAADGDYAHLVSGRAVEGFAADDDDGANAVRSISGLGGRVSAVAFRPDGGRIAIGTRAGDFVVDDPETARRVLDHGEEGVEVALLAWLGPDRLLAARADGAVALHAAADG